MTKRSAIEHHFVEFIPDRPEEGALYVSMKYATAVHRCCCGCGSEVVTPFSPTDWQMTFNGESISLAPSIGNWGFRCQSHYWIRNNRVVWAGAMSKEQIKAGRAWDSKVKKAYYSGEKIAPASSEGEDGGHHDTQRPGLISSLWAEVRSWFRRV